MTLLNSEKLEVNSNYFEDRELLTIKWNFDDLKQIFSRYNIEWNNDNIKSFLTSRALKNFEDRQIEYGWEVLDEVVNDFSK